MIGFLKNCVKEIKSTKKYANDKNVPNWFMQICQASALVFYVFSILTLFSIIYFQELLEDKPPFLYNIISFAPIILTFLFMIQYGKYPIKLMILLSSYLTRGFMRLVSMIDMYYWRKYDKDSVASNFIVKNRKLVYFICLIPGIIYIIISWIV